MRRVINCTGPLGDLSKADDPLLSTLRDKLAVIMHAMWRDGTFYSGDPDASEQDIVAWNAAKVQRLSAANS